MIFERFSLWQRRFSGGFAYCNVNDRPHPLAERVFRTATDTGVRIGSARDNEEAMEIKDKDKDQVFACRFVWYRLVDRRFDLGFRLARTV